MTLDKKYTRVIFFFYSSSKWVVKQWRQLATSTRHLDLELLTTKVQWLFKKFCKGDESLEDEEHTGWPSEVGKDQLRVIIKADLTTTREVVKGLNVDRFTVVWHLMQIGKVKKLS